MNILVINCGSSSLKFQLIDSETEKCIAKGICERIGIEGSQITYTPAGGEKEQTVTPMPDYIHPCRWREGTDRNSHAGSHRSNPSCTGSSDQ